MTGPIRITILPVESPSDDPPPQSLTELEQRHICLMDLIDTFENLASNLDYVGCDPTVVDATLAHINKKIQVLEEQAADFVATTPMERLFQIGISYTWSNDMASDEATPPATRDHQHQVCRDILAEARAICIQYDINFASVRWVPASERSLADLRRL